MHDIYIIGLWPIKSTEGFETAYKGIKERKSVFLALPGKWSHGDHRTWLDAVRSSLSPDLCTRSCEGEQMEKRGQQKQCCNFVSTVTPGSLLGALAAWRGLRCWEAATGMAAAPLHQLWQGQ